MEKAKKCCLCKQNKEILKRISNDYYLCKDCESLLEK